MKDLLLFICPPSPMVDPDTYEAPLGVGYILSYLMDRNHSVVVLDCGLATYERAKADILSAIARLEPKFIAVSSVSATYESSRNLLKEVKKNHPNLITIHGGIHITLALSDVIADPQNDADILCFGEGEETLDEILNRYSPNMQDINIRGTAIKGSCGYVVAEKRDLIKDIDRIPPPSRHLFDYSHTKVMRIMTSRGCPHNCVFCASAQLWNRKIRFHSVDRVIQEMDVLIEKYKCKNILIVDDTFTTNQNRAKEILKKMRKFKGISFSCLSRVDNLTDELLEMMSDANIKTISLGCESADDNVLKMTKKNITSDQIINSIQMCKKHDIKVRTSWIWGFPFDSILSLEKTVRLILNEEPDEAIIYRYVPYPGTEIYFQYPSLKKTAPSNFYSGSNDFYFAIDGLTVEEMNNYFLNALTTLYNSGYSDFADDINTKIATSGFQKFTSFWPTDLEDEHT